MESQQQRLEVVSRDNTVLVEEKRSLKFEINTLKKCLHEQQREMADMRHVINKYVCLHVCACVYQLVKSSVQVEFVVWSCGTLLSQGATTPQN